MAAKAVYQLLVLAVYVTRDELARLVKGEVLRGPLLAGREAIAWSGATLFLTSDGMAAIKPYYAAEKAAVALAPDKVGFSQQTRRNAEAKARKRGKVN